MTTATDRLAKYLAAESEILAHGKSNVFGDRQHTTVDLPEIREGIKDLARQVATENAKAAGAPAVGGLGYSLARLDG